MELREKNKVIFYFFLNDQDFDVRMSFVAFFAMPLETSFAIGIFIFHAKVDQLIVYEFFVAADGTNVFVFWIVEAQPVASFEQSSQAVSLVVSDEDGVNDVSAHFALAAAKGIASNFASLSSKPLM